MAQAAKDTAGPGLPISRQLPPSRPAELARPSDQAPAPAPAAPPSSAPASAERAPPLAAAAAAEAGCLAALRAIPGNSVEPADPKLAEGGDPACRVSEPVIVKALALRTGIVTLVPPPTLACAMARTVAAWLDDSVQPLARGYFDGDLAGLQVGGGHECRRRNRAAVGPVSEHATGKALDIFAFRLGGGQTMPPISVEKPAGPLQARFLSAVRQSACGAFMTALGPGSDAAHANHLHVDIQERRSRASRFCQ